MIRRGFVVRVCAGTLCALAWSGAARASDITGLKWSVGPGNVGMSGGPADYGCVAASESASGMNACRVGEDFDRLGVGELLGAAAFAGRGEPTTLMLVKEIDNDTGFSWTGFDIEVTTLEPGASDPPKFKDVVLGPLVFPSSDGFATVGGNGPDGPGDPDGTHDSTFLSFTDGSVAPGTSVTFLLAVEVFPIEGPDGPYYNFKLTQTPVPEPATAGLVGLGGLLLGRRKRR